MIIDYDIGRRGGLLFAEFGNAFSRSSSVGNKAAVRREGPVPPCRALLGGVRSRDEKPLPAEEANERDVLSLPLSADSCRSSRCRRRVVFSETEEEEHFRWRGNRSRSKNRPNTFVLDEIDPLLPSFQVWSRVDLALAEQK